MYRVLVERAAGKDLRKLPLDMRSRVADVLLGLTSDPRPAGCRKLEGSKADWRIRVGAYRIVYEIMDAAKIVRVYRIRHRREVYR
jgi:mRNA interferase RelE/StbE